MAELSGIKSQQNLEAEARNKALTIIYKLPENFRWIVSGLNYSKSSLIDAVLSKTETGKNITTFLSEETIDPLREKSGNDPGKRYICLVCYSEVLCTKHGPGKIKCCGQMMAGQSGRPIPSSD